VSGKLGEDHPKHHQLLQTILCTIHTLNQRLRQSLLAAARFVCSVLHMLANDRTQGDYQKAGITAIVAQQLFGCGVKLRPGETVEYVITDAKANVPNERVRAYSLWEGWHGYDRKKYAAMLRDAFEPFELIKSPSK
jgi:hypothetical protein